MNLVRPESAVAWELRTAWATRKRVSLRLDDRCDPRRLEGRLQRVATTGAFCVLEGFHVPTEAILAVHHPSRLGDSTIDVPKAKPRCIICRREVDIDRKTEACENCAPALEAA